MDHPLIDLITARIRAAEKEGAFDNLPGAGKPLPREDDPDSSIMGRILKQNGAVPEAVTLSRELARLRETLRDTADRDRRAQILSEIAVLQTRLDLAKSRG
ncbi:DUF1992 domain-containing protein [Pseudoponticoccus marisrubri]|uniref:DnaJ homologue subfamily C member 28 conserved domain-containing protein n=1 Tax=Pseudoponticoccus marisrubri TaxID=1685382 RepID=A0A0W7WIJ8_9RHOB|nr:DUF1992 domain-containing protein [Pseudoponticoccus marisrubri]KUF10451.1 hypothetical protein AVJ23_11205 [Pseudoponticoccus marisrubri]